MRTRIVILFASILTIAACAKHVDDTSNPTEQTTDYNNEPGVANNTELDASTENDASVDSSVAVDSGPKEPTNQTECIAVCETKYPTAAVDSATLDNTCLLAGACEPVCNNLAGGGELKFPSADAGVVCDTAAANSYPIGTPSQACSDCLATTQTCCDLWIKIFGSTEGQALNKCAHDCWEKFPN